MENNNLSAPLGIGALGGRIGGLWRGIGQAIARQTRPALAESNRNLALSSASVGLTVTGVLTLQPLLILAGVPLVLYVYKPEFRAAYRSIRKQRRIDESVLDATRIAVCVLMGYYGTGAANAALYALSERMRIESEEDFEESLRNLLGLQEEDAWAFVNGVEVQTETEDIASGQILVVNAGDLLPAGGTVLYGSAQVDQRLATGDVAPIEKSTGDSVLMASRVVSGQIAVTVDNNPERLNLDDLRETLRRTVRGKTLVQQLGEGSGGRLAPLSLVAFFLTIPLFGINQAAAFLCATFGSDMRILGPVGARHAIQQATQDGIFIKESKALEMANFVNCLVIDGKTLLEPSVRLYAAEIVQELRQRNWQITGLFGRPFSVYVLAEREYDDLRTVAASLNAEEVLIEPLSIGRAAAIDNLQRGGRAVCYVGNGQDDKPVMEKALVSVALGSALSVPTSPAQVIFVEKSLSPLFTFFDMSTQFLRKERFGLVAPIMADMTGIVSTLLTPLGLLTASVVSYGILIFGMKNARTPRTNPPVSKAEPVKTVAIVPVSVHQPEPKPSAKREKQRAGRSGFWFWGRRSGPSWLQA